MNKASVIGIFCGLAAILIGNFAEGGKIHSIAQGSAALIVFGGTLGATFLSYSSRDIIHAARLLKEVFYDRRDLPEVPAIISSSVHFTTKARRTGLVSLDNEVDRVQYGFFNRALKLAIDGMDSTALRDTLEQENRTFEDSRTRAAKVFESAGGYAPTIGIVGAVLGLIHVMENLSDPTMLGSGIAVAFVATVYGVASANLLFLPMAKKLINNMKHEVFIREMIIEGVLGIQSGKNPYYLNEQLSSFLQEEK